MLLTELSQRFELEEYMDFKGYVAADKIPHILNNSSIALQLANKATADGPKGIMTTKLFEGLATERPILCVRSDESYLEETIKQTNSGIAARTKEDAKGFILTYYKAWKEHGFTEVKVNQTEVALFSRQAQAKQFMHLFESLITNGKNG